MANDPNSFDSGAVATAAGAGSTFGPEGTLIGAGLGLTFDAAKYLLGSSQRKAANQLKPFDPGYEMNRDVIDNARILGDQYNNYALPGYQQILSGINKSSATSFVNAQRGATSSADLLDAANKEQEINQDSINKLGIETARGKQSALTAYLAAKQAAGAEYQQKNEYDRMRYDQQLALKYQLNNNATANQFGAADSAGKLISAIFASRGGVVQPGPTGTVTAGQPIFTDTPVQTGDGTSNLAA